ncbi:L,D-transpeptidase [Nocardiopsis suaedae]|uniref:Ig-like domain-containing protein n=1 Tax=Nocardiopsis suaedae TaxID=3018444 RepID=A0ABT4TPI5_9ACTN|nr:Ig-like domain-containing protein [Nocardiopsis suaedae]MDA2806598.1 Ig-like domain-containing protein [Nocardiopsis suaedae]
MKLTAKPAARCVGAGLAAGAALVLASACTGSTADPSGSESGGDPVDVVITPGDGATGGRPDVPLTVEAEGGKVTDVTVTQELPEGGASQDAQAGQDGGEDGGDGGSEADEVTGTLSDDGATWTSDWNLTPGTDVKVEAVAENADGEEKEFAAQFSTAEAEQGNALELESNFPSSGDTVGVGMPIIVNFDLPVENKSRVENSLEVVSEEPNEGSWTWLDDQSAVFRPKEYWKPNQKVAVNMRLAGVDAGGGTYGVENHRLEFEVGRDQRTTIDARSHRMVVERDGEEIKDFPTSVGKANTRAYTTTSGSHLTMEKYANLVMDSSTVGVPVDSPEGYKLDVDYAVRFSNSGEFTHAAPWNGSLGEANLSHGCPNMATSDAKWFYENSYMGDPLEVTGTDRQVEWDNGWSYWELSWEDWLAKSATGESDKTDDTGTPGSVHGDPQE